MPNMPNINKRRVRVRVPLDVCQKIAKKWRKPGDENENLAFVRCLKGAVNGIGLTDDEWRNISEERARNEALRRRG